MHPLRNLPVRSSPPSASSADGKEDATMAGQQPTRSPGYSPTQASAALPGLTHFSSQWDEHGSWKLQDFPSSQQDFLSSQQPLPTDATFGQALPQSWSALMEESTPNFLSGGPAAALDVDPAAPPHPYIDPRMLSVFGSAPAQQAPSLAEPSDIRADSQPSTALDPAQGKRPLSVEPDTAQQLAKRPACGEGVEPDATSGNLDPAWPPTRNAGPINCPKKVLHNIADLEDRAQQLQHHKCVGQTGIRAVTNACAEKKGALLTECPPGTYKFENVVLEKGTRVGYAKSAVLTTDQCLHAVYLLLQRGENGTDELKDFYIHVPVSVPSKYFHTEDSILTHIQSQKGAALQEALQRAAAYRKENPPPEYKFQKTKKMNKIFQSNTALLNRLGYHYAHELEQMLRDCKEVLGDLREGENTLNLVRNGTTVDVLWIFKNGKTADLIFSEDKEKLQNKISNGEQCKTGREENERALAAAEAKWTKSILSNIVKRHSGELKERGWTDRKQWRSAVRDISLGCETARREPKDDESVETVREGVEKFKLTGLGPDQKTIQGLRWVEGNMLREIKFFEKDGEKDAIKEMETFIENSLKQRKT